MWPPRFRWGLGKKKEGMITPSPLLRERRFPINGSARFIMSRVRLLAAVSALLMMTACSTGGVVGGAAGAAGGYAVDGKRGAVIGGLGGAALGTLIDR